jgi:hypothetical protein
LCRTNDYLVGHRLQLDTLRGIARKADRKRLTVEDVRKWDSIINPYHTEITKRYIPELKQYTVVLSRCTAWIDTKSLRLVLSINKACINKCKFTIKYNQELLSSWRIQYSEKRWDYTRMTTIYVLFLKALLLQQIILCCKTKKDLRVVRKFTVILHKQMGVLRAEIKHREDVTQKYEKIASDMDEDTLNKSPINHLLRDIKFNTDYRNSTNEILLELRFLVLLYPIVRRK